MCELPCIFRARIESGIEVCLTSGVVRQAGYAEWSAITSCKRNSIRTKRSNVLIGCTEQEHIYGNLSTGALNRKGLIER